MIQPARVSAPRARSASSGDRIGAIDGLRAVAVAGVIAFHFGLGVPGGFLGIDLFFVISGFVITRLLLIEWYRTGSIGWLRFWARRARRLFPAVLVMLVAVQVWLRLGALPELRATTDAQTVAALAYVSNWYAIVMDVSYWGALIDGSPLTHLWSLAVEEQFYLAWPLLLIATLTFARSRRALAAVAGLGVVLSYGAGPLLFGSGGANRAYLGTDARCGALLVGALCALALVRPAPGPASAGDHGSPDRLLPGRWHGAARSVFVPAVLVTGVFWSVTRVESPWLYRGGMMIIDLAAAAIIVYPAVVPGSVPARLLRSGPFLWVGRLSYSLYLWHWPVHVFTIHATRTVTPLVIVAELVATLALSHLSYTLVERPTRRINRPAALASPLLVCGLAVLVSAVVAHPRPPAEQQNGVTVQGRP
jgi:peptidoglycan/LPS O-acetylase OafA/YrhL